jgi:hypothetical protein
MPYKVLIDIKDGWWSDHQSFPTFAQARTHQSAIAQRWNTSGTAVLAPDGRVLNFQESETFKKGIKNEIVF